MISTHKLYRSLLCLVGLSLGESFSSTATHSRTQLGTWSTKSSLSSSIDTSSSQSQITREVTSTDKGDPKSEYDVVVVGSGIGGLSAAAMLSLYGYSVVVLESHYAAGGCAHGFRVTDRELDGSDFIFGTGPSFFSGLNPDLPSKSSNPLRTILDASEYI